VALAPPGTLKSAQSAIQLFRSHQYLSLKHVSNPIFVIKEKVMTTHRRETDSMGAIDVPADKLWGAQTQRSLEHFRISTEKCPFR
jgi:hypothetical protein